MLAMLSAWLVFRDSWRLTFQRIGLLLMINMLWWLLSLPLITWPPATAGLFYAVRRLTKLEESEQTTWHHFFAGLKSYWLKSWQLALIDLFLGTIIIVSFLFYLGRSHLALRLVAVPIFYIMLLWIGMQLYLFPLLIEQQIKQIRLIFKNAFILALGNVAFTTILGLLLLVVMVIAATLTGPILLIAISFLAVAQTLALQTLLVNQFQKQKEPDLQES